MVYIYIYQISTFSETMTSRVGAKKAYWFMYQSTRATQIDKIKEEVYMLALKTSWNASKVMEDL